MSKATEKCPYCGHPVDEDDLVYIQPNKREKVFCLNCNFEFWVKAVTVYEIKKIEGSPTRDPK